MVRASAALAAMALALPVAVHGHGAMSNPTPKFKDIYNKNSPSATTPGTPGPYTGNDELKGMAEKAGSRCGQTDPSHVQPIPTNGAVQFAITAVHIGPCEVWLDNTKVASARDCWKEFSGQRIPVDFSKCNGGCQLRWVWLATHTTPWEFYDNCVRLGGGGGGGNNGGNGTTPNRPPQPAPAPAPAPVPAPSPTKPSSGNDADTPGTVRPEPGMSGKCFKGKDDASLDSWCMSNCAAGFCPESHCKAC
ncbi:hypothetical protein P43SY_003885 [Pythium insidiosum]|uniref:Chitin-binding type-4 domain-containing protein n=1 Tax=Pythium insidiosum TaxID=114742 RepID=A0AAD5LV26_PYTIN|nr:hypothetical protein P43SY_003885 [Pythium insidiosum]